MQHLSKGKKECTWVKYLIYAHWHNFKFVLIYGFFCQICIPKILDFTKNVFFFKSVGVISLSGNILKLSLSAVYVIQQEYVQCAVTCSDSNQFPPMPLQRHHAQTVRDNSSSCKIDYVVQVQEIITPNGHLNFIIALKISFPEDLNFAYWQSCIVKGRTTCK